MTSVPVTTVADARSGLSRILRSFRSNPDSPAVVIGSHRAPEAVLIPFARHAAGASETPSATTDSAAVRPPMLDHLRTKRALIARIAALNTLADVRVFGSVARGDETGESDIDLLVEPTETTTLFDLAQFEIDMEALLETKVDVVSIRSLDAKRDEAILAEAVRL